ncbi:unnamed protein product [Pedinophyceae sp. YPF-701]|nr:unnamed protein product [Pedinophyceae sp. YPF-701]
MDEVTRLRETLESLRRENAELKTQLTSLRTRTGTLTDAGARPAAQAAPAPVQEPQELQEAPPAPAEPAAPEADPYQMDSEALVAAISRGIAWPQPGEAFWERPARTEPMPFSVGGEDEFGPPPVDARRMSIVHLTAEMAPYAKVGGLGDVVTGLSKACLDRGHDVAVMMPYYQCLPDDKIEDLRHERDIQVPTGKFWDGVMQQSNLRTSIWRGKIVGIPVILLRPDWDQTNLFRGDRIYGGSYNETEAYLFFVRASLEYLAQIGVCPDVLHAHEWQCAATGMLYWEHFCNHGLNGARVVLTVHNMANSGEVRQDEFAATGLPGEMFASVDKALDERTIGHNPERLNLLKGGIIYSNFVTTVSPTYATETIESGAAGFLGSTLARTDVRAKYAGGLNGIDQQLWHPPRDDVLPATFSGVGIWEGKALCKRYLQMGLGMNVDPNKPLVACVTRLVPQKGIHLIERAVRRTAETGGQFVLLGTGHADGGFRGMAEHEFNGSKDVRLMLLYSEALSRLIYAAADIVVVPSMFEPCGLTQMIAMRYGALPLVRATGGLADTVIDVDENADGNGFSFQGTDEGALDHALYRAFKRYHEQPEWWQERAKANMALDWSWDTSADSYLGIYKKLRGY